MLVAIGWYWPIPVELTTVMLKNGEPPGSASGLPWFIIPAKQTQSSTGPTYSWCKSPGTRNVEAPGVSEVPLTLQSLSLWISRVIIPDN